MCSSQLLSASSSQQWIRTTLTKCKTETKWAMCGSTLLCPLCYWNGRGKISALNCFADFEEQIVERVVYFSQDQSCVRTEFTFKM